MGRFQPTDPATPAISGQRLVVATTVFGFVAGQAKGLVREELVGGGVDGGADGNAVRSSQRIYGVWLCIISGLTPRRYLEWI